MHELGIMSSAVDAALAEARSRGAVRVHRVVLRIGALSGVDPDALRFAFETVTQNTPAADSELEVNVVSARIRCEACASDFSPEDRFIFSCPQCGGLSWDVREGREIELARVEFS